MRAFKRFILLFFVVVIGGPIGVGGLALVKDAATPDFYQTLDYKTYNYQTEIKNELFSNFMGLVADPSDTISTSISADTINKAIFTELDGFSNPDLTAYQLSNSESVKLDGLWTNFDTSNQVRVYFLIEFHGVKTTLTVSVNITDTPDNIKYSLDSFKVGKVPVPSSVISYLLNNFLSDLKNQFPDGSVNYDDLYVQVSKQDIRDALNELLKENFQGYQSLVSFDSVSVNSGKFVVNWKFNDQNSDAVTLKDTIDTLRTIIKDNTDQGLRVAVNNTLDESVASENTFKTDFNKVMDKLQADINNPDNAKFTADDEALLTQLSTDFQNLSDNKKNQIGTAIENLFDPTVINRLNQTLQNININGSTNLTDLLFGITITIEQ